MKSSNFQGLNGEIYRKLQNFWKILGLSIKDKACLSFRKFIAVCASEVYCFIYFQAMMTVILSLAIHAKSYSQTWL